MTSLLTQLSIAILCFSLQACTSSRKDFAEPFVKKNTPAAHTISQIYGYSYKDTWEATSNILSAANTPILVNRKEHGLVITDWMVGKSTRLFSGYGKTRIPYKIRYKMKFTIKPSQQGTIIRIDSKEQYYTDAITGELDFQGSLYKWVETTPGGEIQNNLFQLITEYLAANVS